MQEDYSDVILLVENVRFPAHKVILAARSDYFRCAFLETSSFVVSLYYNCETFIVPNILLL